DRALRSPAGGRAGHHGPVHELLSRLQGTPLAHRRTVLEAGRLHPVRGDDGVPCGVLELSAGADDAVQRLSLHAGQDHDLRPGRRCRALTGCRSMCTIGVRLTEGAITICMLTKSPA